MTCCNGCNKKQISIYKGFGTKWDNNDLITVSFDSEIDIDGFGAEFIIGDIVKTYTDIEDGFSINLTAQETATLNLGPNSGTLVLVDLENNKRPFSTELPFLVKDWEDGDIELDGFNITIKGRVEESKLNIKIDTSNPEKINEETIRGYIAVHNADENAHQYIQGLISAETERAERVEGTLDESKANKATTLAGYGITDAYTKTETDSTFATKTELTNGLSGKQNTISDLNTIRANALAGKSARDVITTYGDIVTYNANQFATAAQGAKADSALQAGSNISLLNNNAGYITKSVNNLENYTKTSDLASVAISGSYNDLTNQPTVGNGALTIQKNGTNVATFTANSTTNQTANLIIPTTASDVGALPSNTTVEDISTQTQKNAINSGATAGLISQITTNQSAIGDLEDLQTNVKTDLVSAINEVDAYALTNTSNIGAINAKIPPQASSTNQLADKNFVNSSITTNTANFIGTFNSVAELEAYSGPVTNNDYAFVKEESSFGWVYNRYKYTTATNPGSWQFEYAINNSSFTAEQWAAIDSGITESGVAQITTNQNAIGVLDSLSTTIKTDLVSAVNEVNANKVEKNNAITAATHTKITYDSKGLVTGGSDLQASDIPSLTLSKISDITATASEVNVLDGITATTAELNILDGVTATTSEINVLDGLTASTTELNYVDGVTSSIQTQIDGKVPNTRTVNGKALSSDIDLTYSDVDALSDSTKYGADLSYSGNQLQLLDQDGNALGNAQTIKSSPDLDGKSITKNTSDELQTVGVIDSNDNTTAVKTWKGTLAQYNALVSGGTVDSATLYNITDDFTASNYANLSLSNLNTTGQAIIDSKANVDLSNLSTTGQAIIDGKASVDFSDITQSAKNISNWSVNTTNCLTYIPQDIKLELNSGTLTLKAGSKIYVPNGFEVDGTTPKFDVVTTSDDLNRFVSGSFTDLVFYNYNGVLDSRRSDSMFFSGPTAPTNFGQYATWYDTANNIVKVTGDSGTTWHNGCSFPFCKISVGTSGITSIDQVFNGFGYIGSTVFALPGITGLIPNGRNEDGTLKSIEKTLSDVATLDLSNRGSLDIFYIREGDNNLKPYDKRYVYTDYYPTPTTGYWYLVFDTEKNQFYRSDSGAAYVKSYICICGQADCVYQGNINLFVQKQVFQSLDYNDKSTIASFAMPSSKYIDLTLGASGTTYTAPANGWFYAYGTTSGASNQLNFYNGIMAASATAPNGWGSRLIFPVKKGDVIAFNYNSISPTLYFVYAEGEVL